jgi:hypothetical protein
MRRRKLLNDESNRVIEVCSRLKVNVRLDYVMSEGCDSSLE